MKYGFKNPFKPDPLSKKAVRYLGTPGHMLEIGCGEGADSVFFAERGWRVKAFDKNGEQLRRFRRYRKHHGLANIAIVRDDAVRFRYDKEKYDFVLCLLVLCCMKRSEYTVALRRLRDAVKIGGIIVASARNYLDPEFRKYRKSERMVEPNTFRDPDECCRFLYFMEKNGLRKSFGDFEVLYYNEGYGPCKYGEHEYHGDSEIICRRVK